MSQQNRMDWIHQSGPSWAGPSELESHTEHHEALDATLFHASTDDSRELVFELDAGELRVLGTQGF